MSRAAAPERKTVRFLSSSAWGLARAQAAIPRCGRKPGCRRAGSSQAEEPWRAREQAREQGAHSSTRRASPSRPVPGTPQPLGNPFLPSGQGTALNSAPQPPVQGALNILPGDFTKPTPLGPDGWPGPAPRGALSDMCVHRTSRLSCWGRSPICPPVGQAAQSTGRVVHHHEQGK